MPGHSKYARCSIVVVNVFSKMMQELMVNSPINADAVYEIIMRTKKFKDRLKRSEIAAVQTLKGDGFSKLDVSLIYKIAKFFNFIPPPTRGWGSNPLPNETEIGDDVERIRIARNKLVHKVDCNITDVELDAFFNEFIHVGERIDSYLGKDSDTGYKVKIQNYQTCLLDEAMEEHYINILKEIECLKEQFKITIDEKVIHIYYGTSMTDLIEDMRSVNDVQRPAGVKFVVKGIVDSRHKTELLNELKDEINEGSMIIQFKEAKHGSIILYTDIQHIFFQTNSEIVKHVSSFIEKIFRMGKLIVSSKKLCQCIIVPDQDDIEDTCSSESENGTDEITLELDIKNDIFKTDESFKTHIRGFVEHIVRKTNGSQVLGNRDTIAVLCPSDKESESYEDCNTQTYVTLQAKGQTRSTTTELPKQTDNTQSDGVQIIQAQFPKAESVKSNIGDNIDDATKEAIPRYGTLSNETTYFQTFINRLGLQKYYPDGINLMNVMGVKMKPSIWHFTDIPWLVLKQIIMINFHARDKYLAEILDIHKKVKKHNVGVIDMENDDFLKDLDDQEDKMDLNPMDLLVALFKCSSLHLKQVLATKLFMCKLAVPLCLPSESQNMLSFTSWVLQSIVVDYTTTMGVMQAVVVNCPCDVVSFVRLGKLTKSKSKLLNDVLSDQYHDTFFNRDCPLGTTHRKVCEGIVEGSWYLPSDNCKIFKNVTMFMNLRGDGVKHNKQMELIASISSVVVVLLDITNLQDKQSKQMLLDLHRAVGGVVLVIEATKTEKSVTRNIYLSYMEDIKSFKSQTRSCMLSMDGKVISFSDITKSIRDSISGLLKDLRPDSLSQRLVEKKNHFSTIDVNCERAKEMAGQILHFIPYKDSNFKDKVVPLQGKPWQRWSKHCKSLNKTSEYTSLQDSDKIKVEMTKERLIQFQICKNLGPCMKQFLDTILQIIDRNEDFELVMLSLKCLLDEKSRNVIPKCLVKYKYNWQAFHSARNKNQYNDLEHLRSELIQSEYELAEASFGLEHFVREIGQMYEAIVESKAIFNDQVRKQLPLIGAKLLLTGQPFELMDGDAANVPLTWVKAVLTRLKEIIGDKKMLALSVLGVQSSGKSTLLNTMFGLQFAVSAGRCTRGVFMQLVPVYQSTVLVDYIVVIDTEGLRAPELGHQKYSHDNELATFVIGLGDITIINIKGENTAEVRDVLQIAVHAFLRLKLANKRLNLKQNCVFVHQNVPACDASDKMMQGRQKFMETLDEMTKEAADQESIADIHSFTQVIDFDCRKDVWYFSDLWNGDPPMAPANPGYSRRVADLQNAILDEIASVRETYLTITDTVSRIEDLWKGILKDDFVFSFRNSLELKAYNDMERKYQSLTWKLEKVVSGFVLTEAKSELLFYTNDEDLVNAVPRIMKRLYNHVNEELDSLNSELDTYVEGSSLKDVMIQWKQNKRNRLKMLSDELLDRSKADINKTKEEIRIEKLRMSEQKAHEIEINEIAHRLATEMKGQKPSEDVLQIKFNQMWNNWITKFATEPTEDGLSIKDQIESLFLERFRADAAFMKLQGTDPEYGESLMYIDEFNAIKDAICGFLKLRCGGSIADFTVQMSFDERRVFNSFTCLQGTIGEIDICLDHFKIKRAIFGLGWRQDNEGSCKKHIVGITNKILEQIDSSLFEIKTLCKRFELNYVESILTSILHQFSDYNQHLKNNGKFTLTTKYRDMIIVHAMRYLVMWFTNINVEYNKGNDCESQLRAGDIPASGHIKTDQHTPNYLTHNKLEDSLSVSCILGNYISIIKHVEDYFWNPQQNLRNQALIVTNKLFRKIDTRLEEYNCLDVRFDISFATEILIIISDDIDAHNRHRDNHYNFNLLPPYRAMIVTHVIPYITNFFNKLNERYNKKHSPIAQMEEYKGTVWHLFRSVVESKTDDVIAANFFRDAITKIVIDHVNDLLPIDVQGFIMTCFAQQKYSLMKEILVDLTKRETVAYYLLYIVDPSEYARKWVTEYMNKIIFERDAESCSTYSRLAKSQIQKVMRSLSTGIIEATKTCKENQTTDIHTWLNAFVQSARQLCSVPFANDAFVHVEIRKVSHLENYTDVIIADLEDIGNDIFNHFNSLTKDSVQWQETPVSKIMKKLWGCSAKCMFCAEPCRNTDKDHVEQGYPHKCIQHRPQGIDGWHCEKSKKLVVEFCNYFIQTNQQYLWGDNDPKEVRLYKDYKKHFPDWDIVPTYDESTYWKWVMTTYQHDLKQFYGVELPDIPPSWNNITMEEAIESLGNG